MLREYTITATDYRNSVIVLDLKDSNGVRTSTAFAYWHPVARISEHGRKLWQAIARRSGCPGAANPAAVVGRTLSMNVTPRRITVDGVSAPVALDALPQPKPAVVVPFVQWAAARPGEFGESTARDVQWHRLEKTDGPLAVLRLLAEVGASDSYLGVFKDAVRAWRRWLPAGCAERADADAVLAA